MAEIVGVHGVRGMLKIKFFGDDPNTLLDLGPLFLSDGVRTLSLLSLAPHQNIFLAEAEGVADRTFAEKLRGQKLYLPREKLPAPAQKDAFYHVDLIGLSVKNDKGEKVGRVVHVANFGAGDLIEIKPLKGASYFLPFKDACVPKVDLDAKEITVILPPGLVD